MVVRSSITGSGTFSLRSLERATGGRRVASNGVRVQRHHPGERPGIVRYNEGLGVAPSLVGLWPQEGIGVEVSRNPSGDAKVAECAFSGEANRLEEPNGGSVAGHDEGMDTMEASVVQSPSQDLTDRSAH
jgi:hypothetical protein